MAIRSKVKNATMELLNDASGNPLVYKITPKAGYVLHDAKRDWTDIDPETGAEVFYKGYTTGVATCAPDYDFDANERKFEAVLVEGIPENQIF